MLDMALDNAIADHKTYGSVEMQHRLFARLRREDPIHWTEPTGYRPFWTVTKHADIIEIERQPERFINTPLALWPGHSAVLLEMLPGQPSAQLTRHLLGPGPRGRPDLRRWHRSAGRRAVIRSSSYRWQSRHRRADVRPGRIFMQRRPGGNVRSFRESRRIPRNSAQYPADLYQARGRLLRKT